MDNFSVVLVEPRDSLNIGSVVRAMSNLGFNDIRLIAPSSYDPSRARITACGGEGLLQQVEIFPDLQSALSGIEDVIGFSCRSGRNRVVHKELPQWLLETAVAASKKTALLFGPEDSGLRQEHVEQCRLLVTIPTTKENSSFNLSQAVLIVLYELSKDRLVGPEQQTEFPTWNEFYQLDRIVDGIGDLSGFFRVGTPQPIPGLIKALLRRIEPSRREMGILLGFLGRIERCLKGEVPIKADRDLS